VADQVIRRSFNLTEPPGKAFPSGGVVITSTAGFLIHLVGTADGVGDAGMGFVFVSGFLPPTGASDEAGFVLPADASGARYLGCFGSSAGQPMIVRGTAPQEPGTLTVVITVVTDLAASVSFEVKP
jgi:hypothetical protein